MRKLINYLFLLSILLASVIIISNIINFSKNIIILDDHQISASIKSERMLEPVVKLTHVSQPPIIGIESGLSGLLPPAVSSATGFSVEYNSSENKTIILTNDHFCDNFNQGSLVFMQNYNGETIDQEETSSTESIIVSVPELDLCLLNMDGYIRPVEIVDYDYEPLTFEKVYVVGGPNGDFPIIIDTYVSSKLSRSAVSLGSLSTTGHPFLLISEQIFPGHSGSPIYSEDGRVIGIVFGAFQTYGGLGVSHRDIRDLLLLR